MSGSGSAEHKVTHLRWLDPNVLYEKLLNSNRNTMGVDFGKESTGLCIGVSYTGNVYPMLASSWNGRYLLSPLEKFLNTNYSLKRGGEYENRMFVPNMLFSPQVVNAQTMDTSVIRDIHNKLYAFIKDQLKALEADGQLVTTFFTFVNEANSTKIAKDFLKSRFPELFCLGRFKRMYPDIPKIVLYKQNPRKLKIDFAAFRKRFIDAYAAAHFTKAFLNMGYRQKLNPKKSQGKAKFEKMKKFAISCGYKVDGGQEDQDATGGASISA
ncbi:hypothetical protein EZV62_013085 [Acer yangbiense]|uniref:Uncharacterized protein n=1 Tax=Acer yangbiense TaxID=1000413 RepID=A0A5C7I030_9ROSI|nr:hypothetical protein EZV62_013085 [Acer yangbiense]